MFSVDEMIAEVDIDGDGRIDYDGRFNLISIKVSIEVDVRNAVCSFC